MKKVKILIVGLIASVAFMVCTATYAANLRTPDFEKCHVIPQVAICAPEPAAVPQTKVYSLKKYFGMIIGTDISYKFSGSNILFWDQDYSFYLFKPPLITHS